MHNGTSGWNGNGTYLDCLAVACAEHEQAQDQCDTRSRRGYDATAASEADGEPNECGED